MSKADVQGWRRGLELMIVVLAGFTVARFGESGWPKRWIVLYAGYGALIYAGFFNSLSFALADSGAIFIGIQEASAASALAMPFSLALSFVVLTAIPVSVFRTGGLFIGFAVVIVAVLVPVIAILGGLRVLREKAIKYGRHGVFLAVFIPAAGLGCLGSADLGSALELWKIFGPLLLFVGLLTLLNAPFDWASLGLTRALLRRGLELGGWWPYFLALVDAALAVVIIAALAFVMVIGVQTFDELAVHGGGKPVLPLDTLFDGIAKNPAAAEYWWAYAFLLSSMTLP
jgi:hypothetical protein